MLKAAFLSMPLAVALAGAALADTYVQDFESGELTGDGFVEALATAPDDVWNSAVEDGAYVLTNESAADAVKYFNFDAIGPGGTPVPQREASVTVDGDFTGDNAAAGLLARYDPRSRTYYAFVRTAHGVALYKRDTEGFSRLVNLEGPVREDGGPARLTVRLTPAGTQLLVNGRSIGTIASSDITGDRFGLVALDRGEFRFDDFTVTTR